MINESRLTEFEKVRVTIGDRLTPKWNIHYNKEIPDKVIQTQDLEAIESYQCPPTMSAHPTNMKDVLLKFLTNPKYTEACEVLANQWNAKQTDQDKMKLTKSFAKIIYAMPDHRRGKKEFYLDKNNEIQQLETDDSYENWSGFQGFDIDFSDEIKTLEPDFDKSKEAEYLKPLLYEKLKQYPWFMWVTKSTGGHGVHIYTATSTVDYLTTDEKVILYESLYQEKALCIYKALYDIYKDRLAFGPDIIINILDSAMYKPEQPLYMTVTDLEPLINYDFKLLSPSDEILKLVNEGLHYIHRDDTTGEFFPKKTGNYNAIYDLYWEHKSFFKTFAYNYDYANQEVIRITPNQGGYEDNIKADLWQGDRFYFGYKIRHDGVPTIWEICKYLLYTRGYDLAHQIINSGIYKKPDVDDITCLTGINRVLDAIHTNKWNLKTSLYVHNWVNAHLFFQDTIIREHKSLEAFDIEPLLVKDEKGKILPIQANYDKYFETSKEFKDAFSYNEWDSKIMYKKAPFKDADLIYIRNKVRRDFPKLSNAQIIEDTVKDLCYKNKYNEVQDLIKHTVWDGVKRAETLFIDYLGADDIPIVREITIKWLYGMIMRIFEPGKQFDLFVILYGPEGNGKSNLIRRTGLDKYTITVSVGNNGLTRDDIQKMQKGFIINIDELVYNKQKVEKLKSDLTETKHNTRFAYARFDDEYPVHFVYIATTNDKGIINDLSTIDAAHRRFCPIECKQTDKEFVFKNYTYDIALQILAEVYHMYQNNEITELYIKDPNFKEYQDQFSASETDVMRHPLLDILNQRYMVNNKGEIDSLREFIEQYSIRRHDPNISVHGTTIDFVPIGWVRALLKQEYREDCSQNRVIKLVEGQFYKKKMLYQGQEQWCLVRKKIN